MNACILFLMKKLRIRRFDSIDRNHRNLYLQIFSLTVTSNLKTYISERVHVFIRKHFYSFFVQKSILLQSHEIHII